MTEKEKLEHMHTKPGRANSVQYQTKNTSNYFWDKTRDVPNVARHWTISWTTVRRPPTSKVNFCELVTHFNSKEWIGLFPCSMRDCAESWLNTLAPKTIDSWNSLAESFLIKYFSPTRNAWLKNEIVSFQPFEDETLNEALERFKEILRKCHRHGLPIISKWRLFKMDWILLLNK